MEHGPVHWSQGTRKWGVGAQSGGPVSAPWPSLDKAAPLAPCPGSPPCLQDRSPSSQVSSLSDGALVLLLTRCPLLSSGSPGPGTTLREKRKERHGEREMQLAEWMTLRFAFFLRFYLFIFRARGTEGDREGEKHQCVVASSVPPTGELTHNPGMCPDWESNGRPFGSQASTQSTEPLQPGQICIFHNMISGENGANLYGTVPIWSLAAHLIIVQMKKLAFCVSHWMYTLHFRKERLRPFLIICFPLLSGNVDTVFGDNFSVDHIFLWS